MNSFFVKVLAISAVFFNVTLAKGEHIYKKLEYARFCTDSLHNLQNAIHVYDEIILISKQRTGCDSIRLVAELERIYLLRNMGKVSEVLKSINDAETLAMRLSDYEKLCDLLCIRGFIYTQLGFKNSAEKIMKQAIHSIDYIENADKRNLYLGYIYGIYTYLGGSSCERASNLIKSHDYFERVSAHDKTYMLSKKLSNVCYALALVERGQSDFASQYLSNAISYLDPENLSFVDYIVIVNFASLQYDNKDLSAVEKWLQHALSRQDKVENNHYLKGSVFYSLYNVMLMKKEYVKAHDYLQQFTRLKDSIDKDQIRAISLIEDDLTAARDNTFLKERKKNSASAFTRISLLMALFVLVSIIYTRSRKNSQLGTKNLSPVTISESLGLHSEQKPGIAVDQINELNMLMKQNSPSFMVKFYEYFPSFLQKINELAYIPLNNAELEICAYSKLNFSTKDIALYRKDTVRSVENRKYRIRKKLMLSSETDFVVWISGIN